MWVVFLAEFLVCIAIAAYIYYIYGQFTKEHWYVPALVILGWTFCFLIVFLVPNDVSAAAKCSPADLCSSNTTSCTADTNALENQENLKVIWLVLYWTTLSLTFLVYPIMQDYSRCGHFTFIDKMKTSIKQNLLLYSVMICILIAGIIIYVIANLSLTGLPDILMAAANAYGLFLLISFLGHGLVNVPRRLWRAANKRMSLAQYRFELASLAENLDDSKEYLIKIMKQVRKASELTPEYDPYRKYIDTIIKKCPEDFDKILFGEGNFELSYDKLASLHEKLMVAKHKVRMYSQMYNDMLENSLKLEDILATKDSQSSSAISAIKWVGSPARTFKGSTIINFIEFVWFCYIESLLLRILCISSVLLGIVLVWSELIFFICGIDLSIVSLYVRGINSVAPDAILQICIFVPVVYMAVCSYSSLLRMSASYLCRLTSPLAYNFMMMAHYQNTAFIQVMGPINLSPLGKYFQMFFPVVIVPFCLATLFNFYSKILNLFHIKRFQFDEEFLQDSQIEEGASIVQQERDAINSGQYHMHQAADHRAARVTEMECRAPIERSHKDQPTISEAEEPGILKKSMDKLLGFFKSKTEYPPPSPMPSPSSSSSSRLSSSLKSSDISFSPYVPSDRRPVVSAKAAFEDDPWAEFNSK